MKNIQENQCQFRISFQMDKTTIGWWRISAISRWHFKVAFCVQYFDFTLFVQKTYRINAHIKYQRTNETKCARVLKVNLSVGNCLNSVNIMISYEQHTSNGMLTLIP